ncbi:MAG TPA: TonB-dependent receptor plug domain-containing protein [Candidatus Brocadiia bacterium]|nr:TonB-dependent receptor [Candidatus Brocadiales bacterium]
MKKWVGVSGVIIMLFSGICLEVWADTLEIEKEMPVEELFFMEIPIVVTAARKEQSQFETASATYVITAEDIRRSGATTIPELLRMVPGLNVAQISASEWAISSRGFLFLKRFSGELLVMIDGRSVYTPLFAGVYWDVQDTLLEDIERIEVVRGPGGTLWGANAVNGVINIITKSAKDTQGGLFHAGYGDREEGFGAVRYGLEMGNDVYLRAYAKYFNRDDFVGGNDQWQAQRGGFRLDWDISYQDALTVMGDYYDGRADQTVSLTSLSPPAVLLTDDTRDLHGGNVLLRWQRRPSEESDIILQAYFDNAEREEKTLDQRIDTYDLDFQHRFLLGERQEITWGMGYRLVADKLRGSFDISLDPEERQTQLFSTFLQDQITVMENLWLTLGSKFEHNDFTGFEIQPSGRFLWQPLPRHALWGAISRAVRTSSRADNNIRTNLAAFPGGGGVPALVSVFGNDGTESVDLLAYEIGYRYQFSQRLSLDVTGFYNIYDNLFTVEPGVPVFEIEPSPPHLLIPSFLDNLMDGETYGVETAANWQAMRNWRLSSSFTQLNMQLHLDSDSKDGNRDALVEGANPEHQFQIRSYLNLPYNLEQDTAVYYVSRLYKPEVSGYTRMDMRLGWHPRNNLELSLSLQNLLDNHHPEFSDVSEVPRSVYAKITFKW